MAFVAACGTHSSGSDLGATYTVGTAPGVVLIADVNSDGRSDLVVANEQSNNIAILLGDGKSGFAPAKGSPFAAGNSPNDLATGDFNRDGKLDLACANHEAPYVTVLLGMGDGGFAPAPKSPFRVEVKPHPHGVAVGDLNGDGKLDLVTDSWGTDQVEILFGDGQGGFTLPGTFVGVGKHPYQRLRVADLNGDGRADLITTNLEGDNVTVLLGNSQGTFQPAAGSPFPCGDSPFNFAVGDVNGDGKLDLAIVNSPSSTSDRNGKDGLTVLLGDGKGGFALIAGSPFPTDRYPNLAAIGDYNGDGVGDIAVSCPETNNIMLFLMSRNGALSSSIQIPHNGKPKGLALSDLNGDGQADLVVTNNSANTVTVMVTISQKERPRNDVPKIPSNHSADLRFCVRRRSGDCAIFPRPH